MWTNQQRLTSPKDFSLEAAYNIEESKDILSQDNCCSSSTPRDEPIVLKPKLSEVGLKMELDVSANVSLTSEKIGKEVFKRWPLRSARHSWEYTLDSNYQHLVRWMSKWSMKTRRHNFMLSHPGLVKSLAFTGNVQLVRPWPLNSWYKNVLPVKAWEMNNLQLICILWLCLMLYGRDYMLISQALSRNHVYLWMHNQRHWKLYQWVKQPQRRLWRYWECVCILQTPLQSCLRE